MGKNSKIIVTIILYLALFPTVALADAGLPMIILTFPAMLAAFIPVVFIEAEVLRRILKVKFAKSFRASLGVNMLSTLLGIPLVWLLLLGLELVTTGGSCGPGFANIGASIITSIVESAWLCPHEEHFNWLVPVAFVINFTLAFSLSVVTEYWLFSRIFKDLVDVNKIKQATWLANILSYSFLILLSVALVAGWIILVTRKNIPI